MSMIRCMKTAICLLSECCNCSVCALEPLLSVFVTAVCVLSVFCNCVCVYCRRASRRARDLWWQGVPPSVRGKVWSLAVGNELNITHGTPGSPSLPVLAADRGSGSGQRD